MLRLAVGGVFLFFWFRPRISLTAVAVPAVLAAGLTLFYFSPYGQELRNRAHWSAEDMRGGARIRLWRDTLRMGSKHWLAGLGPETFTSPFSQFRSPELASAYPEFFQESPHNVFLDAFASQGIPGLIILAPICGLGFWSAYRARRSEKRLATASLFVLFGVRLVVADGSLEKVWRRLQAGRVSDAAREYERALS